MQTISQVVAGTNYFPVTKKVGKELSDIGVLSNQSGDIREVGEKALNNLKGNLKTAAIEVAGAGAAVGTAALVAKSPKANKAIEAGFKKLKDKVAPELKEGVKTITESPAFKKATGFIKKLPMGAKIAGAAVGLIGLVAANANGRKCIKLDGKIEQKYQDRAALSEQLV